MSKRFVVIIVVIILGLFGVYSLTSKKDNNGGNSNAKASPTEHLIGGSVQADGKVSDKVEANKVIKMVEYGDFQCPYCGQWYPIVKQVSLKYKDEPRFVFQFRNFPLPQHNNAVAASRAAEAAAKQNKYWEMHDLLYEQQKTWETSTTVNKIFETYAQQLNLDLAKYKTDFASSEINDMINADKEAGTKLGVDSTPSFYINGKKLDPAPTSVDEFSKKIDEALKS